MSDPQTTRGRGWNLRRAVTLKCPKCARTQSVSKDPTDPPNTLTVEIICPDCDEGDFHESNYFDALGRQIDLEGRPM